MNKVINLAVVAALGVALGQSALADETSVSTHTTSTGAGSTADSYKATSGPAGAKVSHTKTAVQANGDGSVSATKQHESHAIDAAGSTHKKSASATTVGADGSSTTVNSSTKTSTP